jgi:hypothetical protein
MEERRTGKGEAAGHLLAELFEVKDEWRHGRVSATELQARIAIIRKRQRAFNQGYLRIEVSNKVQQTFASISEEWNGLMGAAEKLKRSMPAALVLLACLFGGVAAQGQDRELCPRSSLLLGTCESESASGVYVITFPMPNQNVKIQLRARSRCEALYIAVSRGGFSLKSSDAGLTVWTVEEWQDAQETIRKFVKRQEKEDKP